MNLIKILIALFLLSLAPAAFGQGDVYLMLGNSAFEKKDYTRAIEHYNKCLEANPKHTGCLFNRGLARKIAVSFKLAVEDFTAIVAIQPSHSRAFEQRGSCYDSMNREAEALDDFNRAIELNPRNGMAYWYRGLLFKKKKDSARALADFTKMIEVLPNDERGYENRAQIYKELKENDKAVADYTQALQRQPNDALNHYARGAIYFEQGKAELAEADFNRAIALDKSYELMVHGLKQIAKNQATLEKTKQIVANTKPETEALARAAGEWDVTATLNGRAVKFIYRFTVQNGQMTGEMYDERGTKIDVMKTILVGNDKSLRYSHSDATASFVFTGTFDTDFQKFTGTHTALRPDGSSLVGTVTGKKRLSAPTASTAPTIASSNAFGLWTATLQFGNASKSYRLFLERNSVSSPSAMFIVNGERYELNNLKLPADGAISFDLVMGQTPVFFTGKIDPNGQTMAGQFSYTYDGKTAVERWSAQRSGTK